MANPKGEIILINNQEAKLIPLGHCLCGCGGKTRLPRQSCTQKGWIRGRPVWFMKGHHLKVLIEKGLVNHATRERNWNWNGGRKYNTGYIQILVPDHPKADSKGYVPEHVLVCEKALGKILPPESQVHHVNGIKDDNRNINLVLCQNDAYHKFIEQRARAYYACGHANYLRCRYCKQYDDPQKLIVRKNRHNGIYGHHRECINAYNRRLSSRKKLIRAEAPCGGSDG